METRPVAAVATGAVRDEEVAVASPPAAGTGVVRDETVAVALASGAGTSVVRDEVAVALASAAAAGAVRDAAAMDDAGAATHVGPSAFCSTHGTHGGDHAAAKSSEFFFSSAPGTVPASVSFDGSAVPPSVCKRKITYCFMSTVHTSSSKRVLQTGGRDVILGDGRDMYLQATEDYVPPVATGLVLWFDVGDGAAATTAGAAVPKSGGAATAELLIPRRAVDLTLDTTQVLTVGADAYVVEFQGSRATAHLAPTSPGIQGTWGPFGADGGSWTVSVFLSLPQLVTSYGDVYMGAEGAAGAEGTLNFGRNPHIRSEYFSQSTAPLMKYVDQSMAPFIEHVDTLAGKKRSFGT